MKKKFEWYIVCQDYGYAIFSKMLSSFNFIIGIFLLDWHYKSSNRNFTYACFFNEQRNYATIKCEQNYISRHVWINGEKLFKKSFFLVLIILVL